jgi:aliphatic sulfonates family ABC transporter substrate-binding protein
MTGLAMLSPIDTANAVPVENPFIFEHPSSRELLERLVRIAASGAPVLVTGETGTGKEVVAREVHARSARARSPFVAVNAAAFSEQLVESELFGHEKGAFTGAHERKPGWFEAAHGGTLFLDEIGDLPLPMQVKLLRVLSTGEVTRVGSRTPTHVNVRLIAATNVDLVAAMRARRFREDLYYRLGVTSLYLPPLRQRPGDILPLAQHFLVRYGSRMGRPEMRFGEAAKEALLLHDWPGNVRELENVIHQAVVMCNGNELRVEELGLLSRAAQSSGGERSSLAARATQSTRVMEGETAAWDALERALEELVTHAPRDLHARVEAALVSAAFRRSGRNQLETARLLGLSRHIARARLIEHRQLPPPARRTSGSQPPPVFEERAIRIGYQTLGLLTLVKSCGVLDAALGSRDLKISWQEYGGGIQIVDALRRGELDLGVVGDCPAVCAQAEGVPIVYVAAEPPTPRGAAVIAPADSSLRSVKDLRGRRVAVNRAAQAHLLLMLALEEAGLGEEDIELCFEPPARALALFKSGAIDAWAVWDPWLSSARLDLGARVLRDTSGLFDTSVYYIARQEFARTHPELVAELRKQLEVAARWVESDPARAADMVAPRLGFSPKAVAASLDRALRSDGITQGQIVTQQRIADQCLRLRLIPSPVSVADAQWPEALAGASAETCRRGGIPKIA